MKIALVSPPQTAAGGNTTTVLRWEQIFRSLGHEVAPSSRWSEGDEAADLLVALHARKSAPSIEAFPGPVVVAVTGTDLYQDLPASVEAMRSLLRAWRIVVLHPLAVQALPDIVRARAQVIVQSVVPLAVLPPKDAPYTVAVVGHLRAVKDPLTVARAVALLPRSSLLRVVQVGMALDERLAEEARIEMARNERYRWTGPRPREQTLQIIAASHLLAVPSLVEGGANVIGEAIVHGVPPIASRIDGNIGLLGKDWPALFDAGSPGALCALLSVWESDAAHREALCVRTAALRHDFSPEREREAWRSLLEAVRG